jgi:serine O-acetyltransferase
MNPDLVSQASLLTNYVLAQIRVLFPGEDEEVEEISCHVPDALAEVTDLIGRLVEWKERGFDKLVSWQYATFLYKLGNLSLKSGVGVPATDRLFLLNKALHGLDLHPQIELPKTFFLSHTNSAVFAKASYSDYSVFHQNVTVGRKGNKRPTMERYLVMYPASMIIGNCLVRENTVLAPGVRLIDTDTPGNCYVFENEKGSVRFREIDKIHAAQFFDID